MTTRVEEFCTMMDIDVVEFKAKATAKFNKEVKIFQKEMASYDEYFSLGFIGKGIWLWKNRRNEYMHELIPTIMFDLTKKWDNIF